MALKTAKEFLETIKKMKPRVYIGGKWVKNLLDNPVTRSMVMANAAIYGLAEDENNQEVMMATSHLTGEPINRNLHVCRNVHDLDMRQEMALLTSQTVGTCNYRCVGRGPGGQASQGRQVPAALVGRSARPGDLARRRRPPDAAVHNIRPD